MLIMICRFGEDGFEVLFTKPYLRGILKIASFINLVGIKILVIPIQMILLSIFVCSKDETLPNN